MEIRYNRISRIAVASILCAFTAYGVFGQTREEMKAKAELLQNKVDSLADVLSGLRDRYSSSPAERESIAVQMQSVEPALYAAKRELDGCSQYLIDNEENKSGSTGLDIKGSTLSSFIQRSVPQTQAALYRESVKAETAVAGIVADQVRRYGEMNGIVQTYSTIDTEDDALKLSEQYSTVCAEISTADKNLLSLWSPAYDNKNYIYCLAMEKHGADKVLSTIDAETTKADLGIKDSKGICFSDAICQYYHQKKAMLHCEAAIADKLGIESTMDSLARAEKALDAMTLLKPKAVLPERSFIEYDPIKVVRPLAYNSSNPIPPVKVYSSGTIYRILLGSYSQSPAISIFRYYTPLFKSRDIYPGKYTYYIGGFRSEADAEVAVSSLVKAGFRKPRVVVWADGQYYDTMEAWHNSDRYSVEIWGTDELPNKVMDIISENKELVISKAGNCFIVDTFQPSSAAQSMASRLRIAAPQLDIRIVKKQ